MPFPFRIQFILTLAYLQQLLQLINLLWEEFGKQFFCLFEQNSSFHTQIKSDKNKCKWNKLTSLESFWQNSSTCKKYINLRNLLFLMSRNRGAVFNDFSGSVNAAGRAAEPSPHFTPDLLQAVCVWKPTLTWTLPQLFASPTNTCQVF